MKFPEQFLITGTDTGVGKTVVSAILLAGLGYRYWKPIQSGLQERTDTEVIKKMTGLPDWHFLPETYRLRTPASPHVSAKVDGIEIDMANLKKPSTAGKLLVEGAGGVMVPLNDHSLMLDLIEALDMPVLLVARSGLGTINHSLLSLAALRSRSVEVLGVVLNGERHGHNRRAIEHYGDVRVLAEIEPMQNMNSQSIKTAFQAFMASESV
jgi:dethiobiotin synthase